MTLSKGEELYALHCKAYKLTPAREHRFDAVRRWRVDFYFPDAKLAVEIEGGVWSGGRHTRGSGYSDDCRKYNRLAELGIALLRFTTDMVETGEAIDVTRKVLKMI